MFRQRWIVSAVSVVALLGACGSPVEEPDTGDLPRGESLAELRLQAQAVLVRYEASPGVSPAWDATNPPPGLSVESATVKGTHLTVSFTGAPGPATEPCGVDYAAEAVESVKAVAVIVVAQPHADGETCTMVGATRSATANLVRPLGDRAVLEIRQGQPVPVSAGGAG
jgi:hypothetical protein